MPIPKTAIEYFKTEKNKNTEPYQKFYDEALAALEMVNFQNGNSCNTENGTVVSLPCKLGGTVWYISTENPHVAFQKELRARKVKEAIEGILITKDGIYINTYNIEEVKDLCDKVNEDYAYLTKEDAERAIEEKLKKGECENV